MRSVSLWSVATILAQTTIVQALAPCAKDADCAYDGCSYSMEGGSRQNYSFVCRFFDGHYGSAGNNFCLNEINGAVQFCVEPLCPAGSFSSTGATAPGRGNVVTMMKNLFCQHGELLYHEYLSASFDPGQALDIPFNPNDSPIVLSACLAPSLQHAVLPRRTLVGRVLRGSTQKITAKLLLMIAWRVVKASTRHFQAGPQQNRAVLVRPTPLRVPAAAP